MSACAPVVPRPASPTAAAQVKRVAQGEPACKPATVWQGAGPRLVPYGPVDQGNR